MKITDEKRIAISEIDRTIKELNEQIQLGFKNVTGQRDVMLPHLLMERTRLFELKFKYISKDE